MHSGIPLNDGSCCAQSACLWVCETSKNVCLSLSVRPFGSHLQGQQGIMKNESPDSIIAEFLCTSMVHGSQPELLQISLTGRLGILCIIDAFVSIACVLGVSMQSFQDVHKFISCMCIMFIWSASASAGALFGHTSQGVHMFRCKSFILACSHISNCNICMIVFA